MSELCNRSYLIGVMDGKESKGWISVTNRLPENGDYILMSDGRQIAMGWMNQSRKEFIQVNTWADLTESITHWMPLPELPK